MEVTQIIMDKTEYCRYSPELAVITATIIVSAPTIGATLTVALSRLDGYGSVSKKTMTLTDATQYQVRFDLNRDAFDSKGIYRAKQGDYVIQVMEADEVIDQSPMFAISLVTVHEIKNTWAIGVTFMNYEVMLPKLQPRLVTGVTIGEVPLEHYKGVFPLRYNAADKSLSWNSGPAVSIQGLEPQRVLLLDQRQQDYVMADVNPMILPSEDRLESLVIDNSRLTDRDMIAQVRKATDWVQQRIITRVEPEVVDTDPGSFADQVAIPQTYYRPSHFGKWMSFNLPFSNILDVETITGWFNTSKSAFVPREWYVWNERTGIVELVPSSASQVTWQFYNGIFVMSYLLNFPSIPSFWHYRLTAGLRDLNGDRGVVLEAIAKKAVSEMLNSAGSSYKAGYSSQSTSRDGISESAGYTASAIYGTYSAHIEQYRKWLEKEIPLMKKRFNGIMFTSI